MTKATDLIPDIRFNFNYIKPFSNNRQLFSKLEDTIYTNINNFREVDWVHDSRAYNISNLNKLTIQGIPIKRKLDDIKPLADYTKDILKEINREVNMDKDLVKFINEDTPINDSPPTEPINTISGSNNLNTNTNIENLIGSSDDNDDDDDDDDNDYIYSKSGIKASDTFGDFNEEMKFVDTDDVTTYTIIPGRLLSYQAVCDLTKAIARSRLTMNMKKDDSIKYAEERERMKLKQELERYMKMTQIKHELESNLTADIDELSLKQLQYYSGEAKALYERLKTTHILGEGIDCIDKVQSTIFKDGIKIPGTKKAIKLNGVGEAIKTTLFDKKSPVYVATDNLIDKYNLHVSDEFLACLSILNTIFKSASIVDVKDKKKNSETSDNDEEDDEDEESDDNEKNKNKDSKTSNDENSSETSNSDEESDDEDDSD